MSFDEFSNSGEFFFAKMAIATMVKLSSVLNV